MVLPSDRRLLGAPPEVIGEAQKNTLDFLEFADRIGQQVSGGQARLNVRDPQAVQKLFGHVDAQASQFEAATGIPRAQTFAEVTSKTSEALALEKRIRALGQEPLPLPPNSSIDDVIFERGRQLKYLDPAIREQSRQQVGRIVGGLLGAPLSVGNPLFGAAAIAASNAASGNGIDASVIGPGVGGDNPFDEAIRQTLRPSSLAISGGIGAAGGRAAQALRGVQGSRLKTIPARVAATLVDPIAGRGGAPARSAAELGVDFAAQAGADAAVRPLPEDAPTAARVAAGLGGGVAAGVAAAAAPQTIPAVGRAAARGAGSAIDAAGRGVRAIEQRSLPAIEQPQSLPDVPLSPRTPKLKRRPVNVRLDEGVVEYEAARAFERGMDDVRRMQAPIPDSARRVSIPIKDAISDPDIAASLRAGDVVSYTGLRGRPIRLRVRENGELIRIPRRQPLPAVPTRAIINTAAQPGPLQGAAAISLPSRGRRAIFDRIDLASRTGGDEVSVRDAGSIVGFRQAPQLSSDEAATMKDIIRALPDDYFEDVALSIRRQPGSLPDDVPAYAGGAYDPAFGLIELFTSVIRNSNEGPVGDVFIHEVAHNLSHFVTPEDMGVLRRQFEAEKAAFNAGIFKPQRLGTDAPGLNYRFSSLPEWFAETFTDRALRDLFPDETRQQIEGIYGHIKHLAIGLYNWLLRKNRIDDAERVYRELISGATLKKLNPDTAVRLNVPETPGSPIPPMSADELAQVRQRVQSRGNFDRPGQRIYREMTTPPSARAVAGDINSQNLGPKLNNAQAEDLRQAAIRDSEQAFAASDSARRKLSFALDTFVRPLARKAAIQNSKVFKERLAKGLSDAEAAERRGDYQAAARIQQAAQRGERIAEGDFSFQPLAQMEDGGNVVGFTGPQQVPNEFGGTNLIAESDLLSTSDIQALHRQTRSYFKAKGLYQSSVNAQFALNKMLLGQRLQDHEIKLLEEALGIGKSLRNLDTSKISLFIDLLAIPKTLRSSIDMSGLLRQGGFYVINLKNLAPTANGAARRKTIADSVKLMFRAYKGKDRVAREVWDDISTRNPKLFDALQQRQGRRLHLYAPKETSLAQRDEAFLSNMFTRMAGLNIREGAIPLRLAKLPLKLIGEGVERSEVSFTAMLNRIRYDAVEQLVDDAERAGFAVFDGDDLVQPGFLDDITNWANITTGRGNLGGTVGGKQISAEGFAPILNGVFWAPRLATARAETLVRGPSRVVREANRIRKTGDILGQNFSSAEELAIRRTAEEFVGYLGAGMTILGMGALAKQAGVPGFDEFTVELDPRSSNFGKGRFGDTRFDFWGGHQQWIRTLAQIATGKRKTTTTDQLVDTNFAETNFQFVRSKLAPGVPTLATSEVARGTFLGEELSAPATLLGTDRVASKEQLSVAEQASGALRGEGSVRTRDYAQQFLPLTMFEYLDVMRERGLTEGAVFSVPPFFGVGSATFGEQRQ